MLLSYLLPDVRLKDKSIAVNSDDAQVSETQGAMANNDDTLHCQEDKGSHQM